MEYPLHITLWIVIKTAVILAVVYLVLRALTALVDGMQLSEHNRQRTRSLLRGLTALYAPLAIVILVVALILWQQRLIGIPALLCLILFYRPLSHFFQGLAVRAKGDLVLGTNIKVDDISGDIQRWGATELKISTRSGLVSLPYGRLYHQGYTINDQGQTSQYVVFKALRQENSRLDIADIIATSPYARLDTKVLLKDSSDDNVVIQVVPRTDDFVADIKHLIEENNYTSVEIVDASYTI